MLFGQGFQSEDLTLLRQEAEHGKQSLKLVAKLRAECATLEWARTDKGSREVPNTSRSDLSSSRTYNGSSSGSSIGGYRGKL